MSTKDLHASQEKILNEKEIDLADTNPEAVSEDTAHTTVPKEALELLKYRQENEELKKKVLLALAESENTLKRAKKESDEQKKYAVSGFAKDLINVAENLFRALESAPKEENPLVQNIINGVEMTKKELMSVFERHGIIRIFPLNEKFDHNFHQAMVEIPDSDVAPGTVTQVMQAGYIIHDRLLRAALVGVAKAK